MVGKLMGMYMLLLDECRHMEQMAIHKEVRNTKLIVKYICNIYQILLA